MSGRKAGSRHILLLYRRWMNRIWKIVFLLGLVLAFIWAWLIWESTTVSILSLNLILLVVVVLVFLMSFFFFFARYRAFVRPFPKYMKLVTPFLSMNISYRRMRSVRPMLVQQIFPREDLRRSQRNVMEPFYGKTALVLELKKFPIKESWLKIFLPPSMFSPHFTGLVLIVPDWMTLSTEMETFRGTQVKSIKDRAWAEELVGW